MPYTCGAASHRSWPASGAWRLQLRRQWQHRYFGHPELALTYDDRGDTASAVKTELRSDYVTTAAAERGEEDHDEQDPAGLESEESPIPTRQRGGRLVGEYSAMGTALAEYVYMTTSRSAVVKGRYAGLHRDRPSRHATGGGGSRDRCGVCGRELLRCGRRSGGAPVRGSNGGAVFAMNFRLPGQYYVRRWGLYYNYFRSYDPGTGRCSVKVTLLGCGGLIPMPMVHESSSWDALGVVLIWGSEE